MINIILSVIIGHDSPNLGFIFLSCSLADHVLEGADKPVSKTSDLVDQFSIALCCLIVALTKVTVPYIWLYAVIAKLYDIPPISACTIPLALAVPLFPFSVLVPCINNNYY